MLFLQRSPSNSSATATHSRTHFHTSYLKALQFLPALPNVKSIKSISPLFFDLGQAASHHLNKAVIAIGLTLTAAAPAASIYYKLPDPPRVESPSSGPKDLLFIASMVSSCFIGHHLLSIPLLTDEEQREIRSSTYSNLKLQKTKRVSLF